MLVHFLNFVGPMNFTIDESLLHMQMAILGGLGSLPGSILGAALIVSVPQFFQFIYEYRMLINGVIMIVLMIWRPQGIMGVSVKRGGSGKWKKRFARLTGRSPGGAATDSVGKGG